MRVLIIGFLLSFSLMAQEEKENQFIDLGALSIEGEIITPGDLSIDDETEETKLDLYKRKKYRDQKRFNLQSVF